MQINHLGNGEPCEAGAGRKPIPFPWGSRVGGLGGSATSGSLGLKQP